MEDIEDINISKSDLLTVTIQRFCIDDGPGLRTVVFLKGCDLDCPWCQNPESKGKNPEYMFNERKCQDKECLERFKMGQDLPENEVCPHGAIEIVGKRMTPNELCAEILRDKAFFDSSGGGVTFSGGEPLLQYKQLIPVLELCKEEGIHVVIETGGFFAGSALKKIYPLVDIFYHDIKGISVGQDLARVTDRNIKFFQEHRCQAVYRMVIVPGMNDSNEVLQGVLELLNSHGIGELTLLRYNPGANSKIPRLNCSQEPLTISPENTNIALINAAHFFREAGIQIEIHDEHREPEIAPEKRVKKLIKAIRRAKNEVCLERDLLFTEYIKSKRNVITSPYLLHAGALAHVLRNKRCEIYPGELLVGNQTSKRIGGHLYVEYSGALANALKFLSIDRRSVNPAVATGREKWAFYSKLLPFWMFRSIMPRSFPGPIKLAKFAIGQSKADRYATPLIAGASHFTINYKRLLSLGTRGLMAEIDDARDPENGHFYEALKTVLYGLEDMAKNMSNKALELAMKLPETSGRHRELMQIHAVCKNVPKNPASTFYEALQTIVFYQIALVCETSQHGIAMGRIDQALIDYYRADLKTGILTPKQAQLLMNCFSIKISEYASVMPEIGNRLYGGLNNGQAADFGGVIPETGESAVNEVTYMCVEACGLGLKGPNYHARINKRDPPEYRKAVAEVLSKGSPIPSLFNDTQVIKALRRAHPTATEQELRDYAIVGCCEISLHGCHFGDTDNALINIARPLEEALELRPVMDVRRPWYLAYASPIVWARILKLRMGGPLKIKASRGSLKVYRNNFNPESMENVLAEYKRALNESLAQIIPELQAVERGLCQFPTMLTTAILDGPFQTGKEVNEGGARYNSSGIQCVGIADVANSLYAIEKFRNKMNWREFINAIRDNFHDCPEFKRELWDLPKYGGDNEEVDRYMNIVLGQFADALGQYTSTRGGAYLTGCYSMTTHVHFGKKTGALPSGRSSGEPLANGLSPNNGTELFGPTAALSSSARVNTDFAGNGVVVNIKLQQAMATRTIVAGLVYGYFNQGGMQLQLNVIDNHELLEALQHPEEFPDLLVRVSGYAAYFKDLPPEVRQAIADRIAHDAF